MLYWQNCVYCLNLAMVKLIDGSEVKKEMECFILKVSVVRLLKLTSICFSQLKAEIKLL